MVLAQKATLMAILIRAISRIVTEKVGVIIFGKTEINMMVSGLRVQERERVL